MPDIIELNDIEDDTKKGTFQILSEDELHTILGIQADEQVEVLPSELFFDQPYCADYYAERFPGLPDEYYEILAEETPKIN
jgi:hypothetical protein